VAAKEERFAPASFEGRAALEERVVQVYRCAKVVKGGRRFSFSALVVVGDRNGNVGLGYGKANEVPQAVDKGIADAKKSMIAVNLKGRTIPHMVAGHCGASRVTLVPASEGTGVIAGKKLRPLLELAGISDVLTKAYGSTSPKNLLKAGLDALNRLRTAEMISQLRGVKIE
jgi:small subunit ribosomal protein S5